jgi:hypothetical protein
MQFLFYSFCFETFTIVTFNKIYQESEEILSNILFSTTDFCRLLHAQRVVSLALPEVMCATSWQNAEECSSKGRRQENKTHEVGEAGEIQQ